ncbi:MAG TPA: hypothetical protein PLZ58_03085 [Candidatus Saccharibacteria bacterium]|mgnify:CR=1 FL=1|nr:hypothetical protein [Candidatus Saccharibacteria bacterium]HRQ06944.1 hypothetical protein [Candidatus Saccharibacteria bacterium]
MTNEQIIEELGFTNADQEMKDRVVENVRTIVELRAVGIIGELMTEEQEKTFAELQDRGDDQAIWDWLKSDIAGVDVSEIYEAALRDYIEQRKADEFQITI